jgi:hypothetical protein
MYTIGTRIMMMLVLGWGVLGLGIEAFGASDQLCSN